MNTTAPTVKTNLLDLNRQKLQDFFVAMDEKAFRGQQILQWIHQYGVTDFHAMTNINKNLRDRLIANTEIKLPAIAYEKLSADGTLKLLIRLEDGNVIETVYIPEKDRGTLCVSSQVGCTLNCSFCSTGKQGFNRNLTTAEIIGQIWLASRHLNQIEPAHSESQQRKKSKITNVVMMGMGEPLLNYDAVTTALDIMMDNLAYNLSKYRVTVSTAGMVPIMQKLKQDSPVALAVSLHAPNNELRNQLVPLNKKYPLEQLIPICRDYFADESRRSVMFEYVMLKNINDRSEHAKQLVTLLKNTPCKVNLIPFNTFPGTDYQCSDMATILQFQDILMKAKIRTTIRKTRGDDVDGACGQLVGQVQDRTRRSLRVAKSQS